MSHRGVLGPSGSATVRGSRPSHLLSLHRAVCGANLRQEKIRPRKSDNNAQQQKRKKKKQAEDASRYKIKVGTLCIPRQACLSRRCSLVLTCVVCLEIEADPALFMSCTGETESKIRASLGKPLVFQPGYASQVLQINTTPTIYEPKITGLSASFKAIP